mgnify:CR=1 FL=1
MKNSIQIFILLAFCLSCSSKKAEIQEYNLSGKKLIINELLNPEKIRLNSNYLFVLESPSMDNDNAPIHLVDLQEKKYVSSYGTIGFGPGEISDATSLEFGEVDSMFFVYSSIDKKISTFSIGQTKYPLRQEKQLKDFFKAYSVKVFTDSTYIGLTVDSPARLIEFNASGDSISSFGRIQNFTERKDLDYFNLSQINMGWFESNSSKTHFVVASIFTNRIEIFDKGTGEIKSIFMGPTEYTKFDLVSERSGQSVHWDLSTPYFFRDVVIVNKTIIALFGGLSERQIQENSEIAKTVYLISLNGEILVKLNLDTSIRSLAVSRDLKKIFGITTDSDPGIVEFDIPDLIEGIL